MPRRRPAAAQPPSVELTEPTEEELLAQLDQATAEDLDGSRRTSSQPSAPLDDDEPPPPPPPLPRAKRKYVKNSGVYARPQDFDEHGNRIVPGHEYAALSVTGPRHLPAKQPTPPPSLDPNGNPWLYPKKTRQGEGSNLAPFYDDIKQWTEAGKSSKYIAERLIARGVETNDRHVAKQRLKMGFRQRAPRKLTAEAIENMRKSKQQFARPLPTSGDVSSKRVRIRDMRQAEITRLTREGLSAAEIAENLSSRGINMRSGAPTVLRLQRQWGLVDMGGDRTTLRTHARYVSVRRQKEELHNIARELGIQDVDDWVKAKMDEPEMKLARRRYASEMMGKEQSPTVRADVETAVKRSQRAYDNRSFFNPMQQAHVADTQQNPGGVAYPTVVPTQTQSVASQSESPQVTAIAHDERQSGSDSEHGEDDEVDSDNEGENGDEEQEEEEEVTGTTPNQTQQISDSMEVDMPASSGLPPEQAFGRFMHQPLPFNSTKYPPVSHLEPPPSESIAPSRYWQPTQAEADLMAQRYGLFPFHTPSRLQHTYTTTAGLIITMGFEYLPAPPAPGAYMVMVPHVDIPPELQKCIPPDFQPPGQVPPDANALTTSASHTPDCVATPPIPAVASVSAAEAAKYRKDKLILEEIQKKAADCVKMVAARANNEVMDISLTGLPPSRFDIQNAKQQIKNAVEALFANI